MSALVDRAIEAAGLAPVLAARGKGPLDSDTIARLRAADLLALGAVADRIRAEDVGPNVRIYADGAPSADDLTVCLPRFGQDFTGLELLREVAVARIAGPRAGGVRIDWTRCGLEIAQVALAFGANELVGSMANKRGLPIADGELVGVGKKSRREPAHLAKKRELAGFVRRAGRAPAFLGPDGAADVLDGVSPHEEGT